jgi:hypothetical protein
MCANQIGTHHVANQNVRKLQIQRLRANVKCIYANLLSEEKSKKRTLGSKRKGCALYVEAI